MDHPLNNLLWIEDLLPLGYDVAPKHGGLAYYMDLKLILILVERPFAGYEHKGVSYPFQLWNGCILPIEQKKQSAFFLKFSFLENHPANKDWLYIPAESENFEDEVKEFFREIAKRNPLLGIPVKFRAAPKTADATETPVRKKTANKAKTGKKLENGFLLSMLNKKIK